MASEQTVSAEMQKGINHDGILHHAVLGPVGRMPVSFFLPPRSRTRPEAISSWLKAIPTRCCTSANMHCWGLNFVPLSHGAGPWMAQHAVRLR